jgi:hypothetical protein
MKLMKKKSFYFMMLMLTSLSCVFFRVSVHAFADDSVDYQFIGNNSTQEKFYTVFSVDRIFKKISKGDFSDEDFSKAVTEKLSGDSGSKIDYKQKRITLEVEFPEQKNQIKTLKSITFGRGVKRTTKETKAIVNTLMRMEVAYFGYLNGADIPYDENIRLDLENKAEMKLEKNRWFVLTKYHKGEVVTFLYPGDHETRYLFPDQLIQHSVRFTHIAGTKISVLKKTAGGNYPTNFGTLVEVEYKVKLPKDAKRLVLHIRPSIGFLPKTSTFQWAGMSIPVEVKKIGKWNADNTYFSEKPLTEVLRGIGEAMRLSSTPFGESPVQGYIQEYLVDVPMEQLQEQTVTLKFTATPVLEEKIKIPFRLKAGDQRMTSVNKVTFQPNMDYRRGIGIVTEWEDSRGITFIETAESERLISYGRNFCVTHPKTNTRVETAGFILGRVNPNGDVQWASKKDEFGDILWTGTREIKLPEIPANSQDTSDRARKVAALISKSKKGKFQLFESTNGVLQLKGLRSGYTYFFYQTKFEKGFKTNPVLWTFNVFGGSTRSSSGVDFNQSQNWPRTLDYQTYMPIYNLKQGEKLSNGFLKLSAENVLFLSLAVAVVGMSLVAFVLVKRT